MEHARLSQTKACANISALQIPKTNAPCHHSLHHLNCVVPEKLNRSPPTMGMQDDQVHEATRFFGSSQHWLQIT